MTPHMTPRMPTDEVDVLVVGTGRPIPSSASGAMRLLLEGAGPAPDPCTRHAAPRRPASAHC
jgi:hypothetical protein